MRRRYSHRVPQHAVVPFLVFWCLGSFILGQELGRVPTLALVSIFAQSLHVQLSPVAAAASAVVAQAPASQFASGRLSVKPILPTPPKRARHTGATLRKMHTSTRTTPTPEWRIWGDEQPMLVYRTQPFTATWGLYIGGTWEQWGSHTRFHGSPRMTSATVASSLAPQDWAVVGWGKAIGP
jgi:hypothetical protein